MTLSEYRAFLKSNYGKAYAYEKDPKLNANLKPWYDEYSKTDDYKQWKESQGNQSDTDNGDSESENKPKFNITTIALIAAGLFVLYNATKKR